MDAQLDLLGPRGLHDVEEHLCDEPRVGLALPVTLVVARLPLRLLRLLAWPGLIVATVLVGLTQVPGLGVSVNGNTGTAMP